MLKTMLTIAGVLALGQAVQLPAAQAQSGSNYPGSPEGGVHYRATIEGRLLPQGALSAPVGESTAQPRSSNLSGFVCCVSPEGRASAIPE